MNKQDMKRYLKKIANPVKKELFNELYNEEEKLLMIYLYVDRINQSWVSDELGISLPTLTKYHNDCILQLINFYNFEKYKQENQESNCFNKYFLELV